MTDSASLRAEAARVVARVLAGRNLDTALAPAGSQSFSMQDRSLLRALVYGALREHRTLAALVDAMVPRPLPDDPELRALLRIGVFQLRRLRVPAHAAVSETVAAVDVLRKSWARGLVNALLRRYQREHAALEAQLPDDPSIRLSYPAWMVEALRKDWPRRWPALLEAGNQPGPLTLRVNRRRISREDYLARLSEAGLPARAVSEAPDALVLDQAVPVEQLPGFAEGLVSVQDAAAQLAADLLEVRPGLRVLDACAAPGGKAAHLLERCDLELLALDADAQRLTRVQETFARLGLAGELRCGDAMRPADWWDGRPFDRILLDAPCSGTGVIRRHPDIKWLRRAADIPKLAQTQVGMLGALWPLLPPGGILVYSVCSIFEAEGPAVIARFLSQQADAGILPIDAGWGEAVEPGRRLPPGGHFDGFYYCRLRRMNKPESHT